jgi:hypothetical protein
MNIRRLGVLFLLFPLGFILFLSACGGGGGGGFTPTAPSITTGALPAGTVGESYGATISATGGVAPYTFTIVSGTLPTGLTLATNGKISGTPTTVETSTFTVQVTDSEAAPRTATAILSIKINAVSQTLAITTTNLPAGTVDTAYSQKIVATGGTTPYTFSITSGTLPAGLTLSTSGTISGTPTTTGTSPFTVTVTDSSSPAQTASAPLSITIDAEQQLTITTTSLPAGLVGQAYTATIAATGGAQPYAFSITSGILPAGLALSTGGIISGTPTTLGTSPFTVTVTDASHPQMTAHANLSITVDAALAITTTTLPPATIGRAYSATITATGGVPPYTFSILTGSLPNGLTLSAAGIISGTPAGPPITSAFTVQVSDSNTPADKASSPTLTITVSEPLVIVNSTLPSDIVGVIYNTELQSTGGTGNVTYAITSGSLPPGLTLNPHGETTALISGTPNTPGSFPFIITATDESTPPKTATANLSILINGPAILPLNLPVGTTGSPYVTGTAGGATVHVQLFYSGCSSDPTTWSVTAGTLPAGLVLGASNGEITGTPTGGANVAHFTVTALAPTCSQPTATAPLSIEITQAAANNAFLNGNYVFLSSGYNESGGSAYYAGIFTANGAGAITGGVVDFNSYTPGNSGFDIPILTGSSYTLNSDYRGTMTIETTTLGDITFAFTAGSLSGGIAGGGTMVQFDNPDLGYVTSGKFYAQAAGPFSNASFSGNYAFGFKGIEASNAPYSTAGVITSNGAGQITGGSQDIDNAGTVSGELDITPTAYIMGANGRATTTLTTSSGGVGYVFYIVNADTVLFAGTDPTGPTLASGPATLQTGGPFTNASLNVSSTVDTDIYASSSSFTGISGPGADILLGFFTPDGNGNFTLSADENQAGNILPPPPVPVPGTYSVEANGRVALSGLSSSPVLYLSAPNTAYLVGTDLGAAGGSIVPQTTVSGGYLNSTLTGFYDGVATLPELPDTPLYAGYVNAALSGTTGILGFVDDNNSSGGTLFYGAASAQTITTMPSGRASVATGQYTQVIYMVSPNGFISMSTYPLIVDGTVGVFQSQLAPVGAPLVLRPAKAQAANSPADGDIRP